MAPSPPATSSDAGPLDRLQRAVAGWVGPVVYALPILEVWLLSRMGETGAKALLVALQVGWGLCFAAVLVVCARRWRLPDAAPEGGRDGGRPDAGAAVDPSPHPRVTRPTAAGREAHKLVPSASARRTAARPSPRRRGDH